MRDADGHGARGGAASAASYGERSAPTPIPGPSPIEGEGGAF